MQDEERSFTAFAGSRQVVRGQLDVVIRELVAWLVTGDESSLLIFEDGTGRQVDFDLRGTPDEAVARLATHPIMGGDDGAERRSGPGRPKLGVVSREVSLLPRHWEWLEDQPGGMSATLRRLVDEARRRGAGADRVRRSREAAGRVMTALAGDLPGYEEASRALWAGDGGRLTAMTREWPSDVRAYVERLAEGAEAKD